MARDITKATSRPPTPHPLPAFSLWQSHLLQCPAPNSRARVRRRHITDVALQPPPRFQLCLFSVFAESHAAQPPQSLPRRTPSASPPSSLSPTTPRKAHQYPPPPANHPSMGVNQGQTWLPNLASSTNRSRDSSIVTTGMHRREDVAVIAYRMCAPKQACHHLQAE